MTPRSYDSGVLAGLRTFAVWRHFEGESATPNLVRMKIGRGCTFLRNESMPRPSVIFLSMGANVLSGEVPICKLFTHWPGGTRQG